uniref:Uncharacterized protein n=1 Tax=Solanum tuberosum TaxID=4113 RepID=M1C621_SOLTU
MSSSCGISYRWLHQVRLPTTHTLGCNPSLTLHVRRILRPPDSHTLGCNPSLTLHERRMLRPPDCPFFLILYLKGSLGAQ